MMTARILTFVFVAMLGSASTWADEEKTRAVIGGAAGGAVGAAVGDELGERNGAIVGAAVGAAVGTAIATEGAEDRAAKPDHRGADVNLVDYGHPTYRHCPPGQAKKGRC